MQCFYVILECKYFHEKCFAPYVVHAVSISNAKKMAIHAAKKEGLTVVDVDDVIEIECTHVGIKKEGVIEVYGKGFFEEE